METTQKSIELGMICKSDIRLKYQNQNLGNSELIWGKETALQQCGSPRLDWLKSKNAWLFKVACTSGLIFGTKIMKRYPIFSVQIIYHQIDQIRK